MVNWTRFVPAFLRDAFKDSSGNLKPSVTTDSYTGGNPDGPEDLKPSIVNPDGSLKDGLCLGDDLKPSILPVGYESSDDMRNWTLVEQSSDDSYLGDTIHYKALTGSMVDTILTVAHGITGLGDYRKATFLKINDSTGESRQHVTTVPHKIKFDGTNVVIEGYGSGWSSGWSYIILIEYTKA